MGAGEKGRDNATTESQTKCHGTSENITENIIYSGGKISITIFFSITIGGKISKFRFVTVLGT